MKIGLIDVDSHNFPNLALMKISAYHKRVGDVVEWWNGFMCYDRVYLSRVFDDTYTCDISAHICADEIIKGGTGYDLHTKLPDEIEHICPDYSLYPELTNDTAYGYLTRGCPRNCSFCIVSEKEGRKSVQVADLSEWWTGQKNIKLLDPNLTACKDREKLVLQLADSKAWVDFTQGLDVRLLDKDFIDAINKVKTKMIHFAWDFMEQSDAVLNGLRLYHDLGAIKDVRKRRVYVLTNYNTTMDENLYRIYRLRELGFDPYVMIYNKPTAPKEIRRLQRWVNCKFIWRSCTRFEDYKQ